MIVKLLFFVIALLFCYKIAVGKGVHKLKWFFAGILFFPHSIKLTEQPLITFPRLIVVSMLVVFIFQEKNFISKLTSFPLKKALLLVLILLLAIGIFDSRLSLFLRLYRPATYFLENFGIIFFSYYYVRTIKDFKIILRTLVMFFLFFGVYGIFNFLTRSSPFHEIIYGSYGGVNFSEVNMEVGKDRFRISSFAWHAIYYGLLTAVEILSIVFILTADLFKKEKKAFILIAIGLVIINLFLVNSRTPIIALAAGLSLYYFFTTNIVKKIKLVSIGLAFLLLLFSIFPQSTRILEATINTFSSSGADLDEGSSSSLKMRELQLAASTVLFINSPIVGNGYFFIIEGLGYSSDKEQRKSDGDLFGFESYSYKLLIEQGICGILANIIFFGSLIGFSLKGYRRNSRDGKRLVLILLSLLLTFLLFIFGTGDMNSFLFVVSLIGVFLKGISIFHRNNAQNISNMSKSIQDAVKN